MHGKEMDSQSNMMKSSVNFASEDNNISLKLMQVADPRTSFHAMSAFKDSDFDRKDGEAG